MMSITSRKNPVIGEYRRLASDRSFREETRSCLGQGRKLLEEARSSGLALRSVMSAEPVEGLDPEVSQYRVTRELLEYVSPMKSAPELLFVCRLPEPGPVAGDRLLLAEDLQDPGNVGTLIRTANAFGFDGVILAGSCADPFGPKAVRASMGAVFRRSVWTLSSAEAIRALRVQRIPLVAAALRADAQTAGECRFPPRLALAIGNEGHGLSSEMLEAADLVVRIPMESGAESLNAGAAAAVLLWEVYRRRGE
ncbi:MAG: RNA methyltransferase [Oscillospiraceae bacterium]|nr:RNA methyltransferase [Oscillospiraceae bacterium]